MPRHTVEPGDHIVSIAARHGFHDWRTVWDDPDNADLRELGRDPFVLQPGDVITVPDHEAVERDAATAARWRFVVRTGALRLRLQVRDFGDEPIADHTCILTVGDRRYETRTDGAGFVDHPIDPSARVGRLELPELGMVFPLRIGWLDPIETDAGWQARLINLRYFEGPIGDPDDPILGYAIQEFQCDEGLPVTGHMDDATRARLQDKHGS